MSQAKMDRLRAARGLPPLRTQADLDGLMDRTRAAVAFLGTSHADSEALKLQAFLALFHPEIEAGTPRHLDLIQGARARDRRR